MAVDIDNAYTLLTLAGIGEAPYSMRGLDMQFTLIEQSGQWQRNINGGFVYLGDPAFDLYRITISCSDQRAPPFGGLLRGQKVLLTSAIEVGHVTLSANRTLVGSNSEDGVTYGRPQLKCRVTDFSWGGNEYRIINNMAWSLTLEETTDADYAG